MGDRAVIIKGIAGMGNRLRVIAAAIDYARMTGRKLYVDWTDGMFAPEGTNAFTQYFRIVDFPHADSFTELDCDTFYPPAYKELEMDNCIYNYFQKEQIKNRFVRKGMHYAFKGLHRLSRENDGMDSRVSKWSQSYQSFVLKPELRERFGGEQRFAFGAHLSRSIDADAVIYCDNIPFYDPETMRRHIALSPEMQSAVDDFVRNSGIGEGTVGVHVRMSGKKCYGDLSKFLKKLGPFCESRKLDKIFLCTDNSGVEKQFMESFGDMVITQPKYLPEISGRQTGIHDFAQSSRDGELIKRLTTEAVVDMFSLSRTEYLFTQFGSTFGEISKVYHRDPAGCKSWMAL